MKVLLDNCIDRHLGPHIVGHEVIHARDIGWKDLENGALLRAAASAGFGVMITVDKNIRYQQNLSKLPVAIIEFDVLRNRIDELLGFVPHLASALDQCSRFAFISIKIDGTLECLADRSPSV